MTLRSLLEDPLCAVAEALNHEKHEKGRHQSRKSSTSSSKSKDQSPPHTPTDQKDNSGKFQSPGTDSVDPGTDKDGKQIVPSPSAVAKAHVHNDTSIAESQSRESLADNDKEVRPISPPFEIIHGTKLYAISDIHLSYPSNISFFSNLTPHRSAGLIIAGDIGEKAEHLELAFSIAVRKFRAIWWVPGNHELYSVSSLSGNEKVHRGVEKYDECVEVARRYGVYTPEDEYVIWKDEGSGVQTIVALVCTLYDYSFGPEGLTSREALKWAEDLQVMATDEAILFNDPFESREEWCHSLVTKFERKLEDAKRRYPDLRMVLVNHWPLRRDTVRCFKYPEFIIWCGTTKTEEWHERFDVKVVVTGHIHIRRTDWRKHSDGSKWTRFEEVSVGYPREWKAFGEGGGNVNELLREILPGVDEPKEGELVEETVYRRFT